MSFQETRKIQGQHNLLRFQQTIPISLHLPKPSFGFTNALIDSDLLKIWRLIIPACMHLKPK